VFFWHTKTTLAGLFAQVDSGHSSKVGEGGGQEKLEWQLETLFIAACGPKTAGKPRIMTRNISRYKMADLVSQ